MSLKIIKSGILDSIQDFGRYGSRHLGVNPTGVIDPFSAAIANSLVGNNPGEAVIEMHYPAPVILFEKAALISIAGANFTPSINGEIIPVAQPLFVPEHSVLQLGKHVDGARCYLAIRKGFMIPEWMNSYSTNLKANAGGFQGRSLQKDDLIDFRDQDLIPELASGKDFRVFPWKADTRLPIGDPDVVHIIKGAEWNELSQESEQILLNNAFVISPASDRMGYQVSGEKILRKINTEMLSSAVNSGTIQLLPSGSLIILMADHQTTGGYPRVAHVISASIPQLAQKKQGDTIRFNLTDIATAETLLMKQFKHLAQVAYASRLKMNKILYENN